MRYIKYILIIILLYSFHTLSASPSKVFDIYERHKVKYTRNIDKEKKPDILGYYLPHKDKIYLLTLNSYPTLGQLNHTALHELGHWARHPSRLGPLPGCYGKNDFYEEIVVDIAAAILADELKLERMDDDEIIDYLNDQRQFRRLTKRTKKVLSEEIRKTTSYLLEKPYEINRISKYLIDFNLDSAA